MEPTPRMSAILPTPATIVQNTIGAIIILISLMNPSPRGRIAAPVAGASAPSATPAAMPIRTWTYKRERRGVRAAGPVRAGAITSAAPRAGHLDRRAREPGADV